MKALQEITAPMAIVGALGDIFWDLPPRMNYFANEEIHCTINVANTTDDDHTYMLRISTTKNGSPVSEGTLRVNSKAWFDLGSWEYAVLPGTLVVEDSDVILTVELIEEESGEATDSVSVELVVPSVTGLSIWGGTPGTAAGTDIFGLLVLMMMMGMMSSMFKSKKEKEKVG